MNLTALAARALLPIVIGLALCRAACAGDEVDFARDVKPILKERCVACHGALKQESELRLDSLAGILQGGEGGRIVEPGKVAESRLIDRVTDPDPSTRMPPEGEPLTAAEISSLKTWIENGALAGADDGPDEDPRAHWSFQRVSRPAIPLAGNAWATNPIDAFIAEGHQRLGLVPNRPAAPHVLLRRLYLDLIGLPPKRQELAQFLADPSQDAYQQAVDRLLASPAYGERWGRHWMDVWRYSDWYGRRMENDVRNSYPHVWRWRDWIVESLNADVGYDQMVRQMLAADELFPEDDSAIRATGFLVRNWYSLNYDTWMKDLVEHTSKAFLGMRLNCAHCHDHKYDPVLQEEYFRFRAFFEPLELRHDRVPGGQPVAKYIRYMPGSSASLSPIPSGLARVYDHTLDAQTFMYRGGDSRDRIEGRPPVQPGGPAILGGGSLAIEPVSLPPQAYYPGLKPFVREQETGERMAALAAARQAVATSSSEAETTVATLNAQIEKAAAELAAEQAVAAEQAAASAVPAPHIAESPSDDIGYWRFEGADNDEGFLADFSGQEHTLARITGIDPPADLYPLSSSGMGQDFLNSIGQPSRLNRQAAVFHQRSDFAYLATQPNAAFYANTFSLEAMLHIAVAAPGFNRTVAEVAGTWTLLHRGLDTATSELRLLLVNSTGGVRDVCTGAGDHRLILETGRDYYLAIVVDDARVTFYVRNLSAGSPAGSPLESYVADRKGGGQAPGVLARPEPAAPFKIGNSDGTGRHDGLLDEVRYSRTTWTEQDVLARSTVSDIQLRLADARRAADLANARLASLRAGVTRDSARLAAAEAELAGIEARKAADDARYLNVDGLADQLAKGAGRAQRMAALAAAHAALASAEKDLADVRVKSLEGGPLAELTAALERVAQARTAIEPALAASVEETSDYTQLSPTYPVQSTGRRAALARWLASADNPRTARVAVNHIWLRHFGRAIVETVYDLGPGGKPPSNPELLDWLASELVDSGWSMKHIHRQIITSSTYRMDSRSSGGSEGWSANVAADKSNRYWWRCEARRMEAEVVRDSILNVSGRLDAKFGGPELDPSGETTIGRRSLYFSIHPEAGGSLPFARLFDPPDPCDCYVRSETLVPQQALALTNAALARTAGRALARSLHQKLTSPLALDREAFVVGAYEQVLCRQPSPDEFEACLAFMDQQRTLFASAPAADLSVTAADDVLPPSSDPELRACESLVRVLLNHHDFVTIR